MRKELKVGDHVSWNSEVGRVRGTVQKIITKEVPFKSYIVRASKNEPQYLLKSDKTGHLAVHKRSALRKISQPKKK